MTDNYTAMFDLEPHGTPCMVCGEPACVCRAAGTLEAQPGAWPIDPPRTSEQTQRQEEEPAGCSCSEDPDGFGLYDDDGWPCPHS